MNFSINNFCKPAPNFTALKFTKEKADYSQLSDEGYRLLKQIKEEQEDFKHVDVEVGKFTHRVPLRPYFPDFLRPFDVVVNTRYANAYTNFGKANNDDSFVKVRCDNYIKCDEKHHNNENAIYKVANEEEAKDYADRLNNAHGQIEKAKIFAELIESSTKLKCEQSAKRHNEEMERKKNIDDLMDSCEKV